MKSTVIFQVLPNLHPQANAVDEEIGGSVTLHLRLHVQSHVAGIFTHRFQIVDIVSSKFRIKYQAKLDVRLSLAQTASLHNLLDVRSVLQRCFGRLSRIGVAKVSFSECYNQAHSSNKSGAYVVIRYLMLGIFNHIARFSYLCSLRLYFMYIRCATILTVRRIEPYILS